MASDAQPEEAFDSADEDSYAIWSILIPILRPQAKRYLVPSVTAVPEMINEFRASGPVPLPPIEKVKLGGVIEIKVPPESLDRFESAAEAFKIEKLRPVSLELKLMLPNPYMLMDKSAMEDYSRLKPPVCVVDRNHPWHRDRSLERKYADYAAPCVFSRVYFDRGRSLGLVWAENDLGLTVFSFGKESGEWQHLSWSASGMMINC